MSFLATAVAVHVTVTPALSFPSLGSLGGLLASLNGLLAGVQNPLAGPLAGPVNGILNGLLGSLPPINL